MHTLNVKLGEHSYNIVTGERILSGLGQAVRALNCGHDAVVVSNPVIMRHHGAALLRSLHKAGLTTLVLEVPSGERSKSAPVAFKLIEKLARHDVRRKLFVVAFGGGVVGDLAGYVAAAYIRGVPYIQVPTTLLAQVDSAIGGKVAVDLPVGKNLVGAFYQPRIVFSDVDVLKSLTLRQIRNGLAEVIKYGIICDKNFFDYVDRNIGRLLKRDQRIMTQVVNDCSTIKARIVECDERETKGVRTILNFGHTIGHAIEAANQYCDYHHGEAVALGMRAATTISHRCGLLKSVQADKINSLITRAGLPEKLRKVPVPAILKHMEHDKKFKGRTNRFVLATAIGSVRVMDGINRKVIISALEELR